MMLYGALSGLSLVLCVLTIVGMVGRPGPWLRGWTLGVCYLLAALAIVAIVSNVT